MASGRPTGRPSIRTPEMVDSIIDQLGDGVPLAQICRQPDMPKLTTFYEWVEKDPELSERFARARRSGFDQIALDALRIADTPQDGVAEEMEPGEDGQLRVTKRRRDDMLGHRKLQFEARMKLLAKWDPKRYGEKLELASDPTAPVMPQQDVDSRAVARRIAFAMATGLAQASAQPEPDEGFDDLL